MDINAISNLIFLTTGQITRLLAATWLFLIVVAAVIGTTVFVFGVVVERTSEFITWCVDFGKPKDGYK